MAGVKLSIYFLVPFIWGMVSVFTYVVSFQLSTKLNNSIHADLIHYSALFFLFSFSFVIGYILLKFVLKPTEELLARIQKKNLQAGTESKENLAKTDGNKPSVGGNKFFSDELDEYRKAFGKIAIGYDIEALQHQFPNIIFESREMAYVLEQVLKVAPSNASVLILGQSGTGKELIADAVHGKSPRTGFPFVKINCGAISPGLLESELFGHEKGAFTGAVAVHQGCFERADKGTLFLDEVGELPGEVQVKLLRVLQNGEFQRVGGHKTFKVDVRIIAATNKDLERLVRQGQFREDLFYRLNVFNLNIPPLGNRTNDLELLIKHFTKKSGKTISDAAVSFLKQYEWQGNIRELENKIEKAVICSETDILDKKDFDFQEANLSPFQEVAEQKKKTIELDKNKNFDLDKQMQNIEIDYIVEALRQNNGIQARAAEMLGIKPRSLWNRIKKFDINVAAYK